MWRKPPSVMLDRLTEWPKSTGNLRTLDGRQKGVDFGDEMSKVLSRGSMRMPRLTFRSGVGVPLEGDKWCSRGWIWISFTGGKGFNSWVNLTCYILDDRITIIKACRRDDHAVVAAAIVARPFVCV
jgi:hypothetical protein